mgnify:CR=1 FL=1
MFNYWVNSISLDFSLYLFIPDIKSFIVPLFTIVIFNCWDIICTVSKSVLVLFDIFFKLRDDYDCSIVIVTHNPENAKKCDRKLQIVDGKIKV